MEMKKEEAHAKLLAEQAAVTALEQPEVPAESQPAVVFPEAA